jgi:predicted HTH transcriptional regulator
VETVEKITPKDTSKGIQITPSFTNLEQKMVNIMELNSTITRKDLAEMLGIGVDTVKEYLKRLKRKGVLNRIGNNRNGYWEITI